MKAKISISMLCGMLLTAALASVAASDALLRSITVLVQH